MRASKCVTRPHPRIVGLSLVEAMQALLPEHRCGSSPAAQAYKDKFFAMRPAARSPTNLVRGIGAIVEQLASEGWMLGVATGKSDRGSTYPDGARLKHHFVTCRPRRILEAAPVDDRAAIAEAAPHRPAR